MEKYIFLQILGLPLGTYVSYCLRIKPNIVILFYIKFLYGLINFILKKRFKLFIKLKFYFKNISKILNLMSIFLLKKNLMQSSKSRKHPFIIIIIR